MYTVEIFVGVFTDNVNAHTWIGVTDSDGNTDYWGFHPADPLPSGLNGAGVVKDDYGLTHTNSSGPLSITSQQYDALVEYINRTREFPPPYALIFGSNCTHWALAGLAEAGVIPQVIGPAMEPDNIVVDFLQTLIFNPILQNIGFNIYHSINSIKNVFNSAQQQASPIIFDLDGNGVSYN
ncbi:hypothetical protein [Nitrincola sp. MINF-07-Sa-05]|uniref:hypothetical protein n=1 Tax=Nitrincola salilacus TaxID=3400273 RepID=UPI0039184F6A